MLRLLSLTWASVLVLLGASTSYAEIWSNLDPKVKGISYRPFLPGLDGNGGADPYSDGYLNHFRRDANVLLELHANLLLLSPSSDPYAHHQALYNATSFLDTEAGGSTSMWANFADGGKPEALGVVPSLTVTPEEVSKELGTPVSVMKDRLCERARLAVQRARCEQQPPSTAARCQRAQTRAQSAQEKCISLSPTIARARMAADTAHAPCARAATCVVPQHACSQHFSND